MKTLFAHLSVPVFDVTINLQMKVKAIDECRGNFLRHGGELKMMSMLLLNGELKKSLLKKTLKLL